MGLSAQTNGLLARYDLNEARTYLLLIEYPDARAASTRLAALRRAGQVEGLVAAAASDNLLGAVFGQVDAAAANDLLTKALGNE